MPVNTNKVQIYSNTDLKQSEVHFKDGHGTGFQATLQGLTRYSVTFELSGPFCSLRISEVLTDFVIVLKGREAYSDRATIRQLVHTGTSYLCEVTLREQAWKGLDGDGTLLADGRLRREFDEFLAEWGKGCRIREDYKVVVSDMQSFFLNLRLWLHQVQLEVQGGVAGERTKTEIAVAEQISTDVLHCMDELFERFESIAMAIPPELQSIHRSYMRRILHPLVLAAPFAHRTFFKPLGYAGDYEMVNMIARNRLEGETLYAKVVNAWFLRQPPAQAHRNRINYLRSQLISEILRAKHQGRVARILSVGCGPALEVQPLLQDPAYRECAHFTLLDFNEETVAHVSALLGTFVSRPGRSAQVQVLKKSVHHILKESLRQQPDSDLRYDLVYCAGLFDYLTDRTCQQLTDIFYSWTERGGLVITTNVEPQNPLRYGMEHLLDWNLIYRNASDMAKLKPAKAAQDDVKIISDLTGVNVFLEARK